MGQQAVIIDIDNTLVDTLQRKYSILKNHMGLEVSLEEVKNDFHLTNILGGEDTQKYGAFFNTLSSEEGILNYPAPPFEGAVESIKLFIKNGFKILLVTARSSTLRAATIEELKRIGLDNSMYELFMAPHREESPKPIVVEQYKSQVFNNILENYDVLATISDRPEDIEAAYSNYIPAIIYRSTLTKQEAETLRKKSPAGADICANWPEVVIAIERFKMGMKEMEHLRDTFTQQYSSWLSDIDSKSNMTASIAGILAALSGNLMLQITQFKFYDAFIIAAFMFSVFSMIYSIRAFTSRHTSGASSTFQVSVKIKQIISILFGFPEKWMNIPNDAVDEYTYLRKESAGKQAHNHIVFFYKRYHTYEPEALKNLRLLELRASNYSKVYAERIASNLLIWGIFLAVLWIVIHLVL